MKNILLAFLIAVVVGYGVKLMLLKVNQQVSPPKIDEQTNLTQKMTKLLQAKYGNTSTMNVYVTTLSGNYAKGEVNTDGGGGLWFAAKRNNEWELVWDGNGIIQCPDLLNYPDFPRSIIPKCFDTSSDMLKDR